jgi:hypothetical protein
LLCPDKAEEAQVPSQLLTNPDGRIVAVLIVFALATAIKALASVLRTWIEQTSRTRRLTRSLEGTKPYQRSGIIMACGQLEAGPAGGRGSGETHPPAPEDGD